MLDWPLVAWLEETLDTSLLGAFSVLDLQWYQTRLAPVVAGCQDRALLMHLSAAQRHLQRAIERFDDHARRYGAIERARASLERVLLLSDRFLEK